MFNYLFFKGCTIPASLPNVEKLALEVLPEIGINLIESDEFTCCPDPIRLQGANQYFWISTAARNITIAEEKKLNITEDVFRQNNGSKVLHPLQVAIIIKEQLRRIYIWKGISSSVRKKFIASRVASELQKKLTDSSNFHRCKIISVDQGDEPEEFLNAFGFKEESIPVILKFLIV